jgi:Tol biopolymer transport system component
MKKLVAVIVLIAIAGAAAFFLWMRSEPKLALVDPACPSDAPVMAIDLYGDLRQDDVAVIHADGKVERLTNEHASFGASFSPDGKQIVFTSGREGDHEECCGYFDQEIYVMNTDGSDQRRLMEKSNNMDWTPAWSPDGTQIAFVRDGTSLMVVDPEGNEPHEIAEARVEIRDIEWSPDSEKIAYLSNENLFVVDVAGGEPELIAEKLASSGGLAWSPDGETIALSADFSIHTLTFEEPNPKLFARDAHTPAWSPDGEFLAYYLEDDSFEQEGIYTKRLDGEDESRLDLSNKNIYSFSRNLEWLNCSDPG